MKKIILAAIVLAIAYAVYYRRKTTSAHSDKTDTGETDKPIVAEPIAEPIAEPKDWPRAKQVEPGQATPAKEGDTSSTKVGIPSLEVDEINLKVLIDWFVSHKDKIQGTAETYKGIILKYNEKGKHKDLFVDNQTAQSNILLVGFFNSKQEIAQNLPLTFFKGTYIAGDLAQQFGSNDLIIIS